MFFQAWSSLLQRPDYSVSAVVQKQPQARSTHECGCVPIKFHSPKQVAGQTWPMLALKPLQ